VAFFQWISALKKARSGKQLVSPDAIPRVLVLPRTGYLAPVAATVAAWLARSFQTAPHTLFARLIDDIDNIEQYVPVLHHPIPDDVLTTDLIFGPAQVRWNGIRPPGEVSYRAVVAPDLSAAFLKLVAGGKHTQNQPYRFQIIGYDQTRESRVVLSTAFSQPQVKIFVVTGQPAIALSGAQSALVVSLPGAAASTIRELFNDQESAATVSYWTPDSPIGRPPALQEANTLPELFAAVARTPNLPFNAIFCPLSRNTSSAFQQLDAAYACHVPVIFEVEGAEPPLAVDAEIPIIQNDNVARLEVDGETDE
jgi:hypothetical protein